MPHPWGYSVFPLYPFRKPASDICKVTDQCLLEVSRSLVGMTLNQVREERAVLMCMRVLSSTAKAPLQAPSSTRLDSSRACVFSLKINLKKPNFSVIYKFAVTGRAREASCYLHTAFIWALDQLLMTLVSGWWQAGTATAGMRTRVWLQTSCVQNHAQQIKLN